MSDDILDAAELLEECEGDREMLARWVEIFDRDCAVRLPRLQEAVACGDAQAILEEAHAIKGSVGTFFAAASFETAFQLESMGRTGELEGSSAVFDRLQAQVSELRRALGELINN